MSESPLQMKIVMGAAALAATALLLTLGAASALGQNDELVPDVRVPAQYPTRELQRGRSGEVTLRFTIAVDGTTKDIEVVESTSSAFARPAVAALSKWRYLPQTENGVPVEKRGIQTVIRFEP